MKVGDDDLMIAGDKLKVIAIPASTTIGSKPRRYFENAFEVGGLEPVEGLPQPSAQPAIGEGAGGKAHMHSVYAELSYLLLQSDE